MDGFISRIDRLVTEDGPGTRTTVLAVGCPLKCLWCANPELMGDCAKFLYHPGRCIGCGSCMTSSGGETMCCYDAYAQIGGIVSERELADMLLEDKTIYAETGGGVTFSGGDAAMQAEFFIAVAQILKRSGIHVAFKTTGYFPWELLSALAKETDLVIYDIKMLNRYLHKRYTGADNQLILDNAFKIAASGKKMIIRMILIPGVNDSKGEIAGRLKFAGSLGGNVSVEIIKYRKPDAGKFASLNMIEMMEGTPECPEETYYNTVNMARSMGIEVYG